MPPLPTSTPTHGTQVWEAGRSALAVALSSALVRQMDDEGIAQSGDAVQRLANSKHVKAYVDAA